MQKSEKYVPHKQPPLHVQLGNKNGLDNISHIHSDKTNHPNYASEPCVW